ncbi:hypothetical protein ACS0TY_026766 [Phlomoides rotata]
MISLFHSNIYRDIYTNITYPLFIFNGSPTNNEFHLEKGIYQESAVEKGFFSPCSVGKKMIKVAILQYADDTIFFSEAMESNIFAIKCILRVFEM